MLKVMGAVLTAVVVTTSLLALAQAPSDGVIERLNEADVAHLTDARVNIVKAALQLTADQEKLWPAVEDAIRARAKDRQTRIANLAKEAIDLLGRSPLEVLRDRNPIDFLQQRAAVLTQRGADLKKLADAWQPLYQTLTQDQKRQLALLAIVTLREMRNPTERRRILAEEEDDDF
jgi:LTXXQ motif family protein